MDFSIYFQALDQKQLQPVLATARPDEDWTQSLVAQLSQGNATLPPLDQQVFPGDSVVLAISNVVPQWRRIASTIVQWLGTVGVLNQHISIVVDDSEHATETKNVTDSELTQTNEQWPGGIQFVGHQAANSEHSTMVGVSRLGEAIYLNSSVANADVVIPIVLAGAGNSSEGYFYPGLSSQATRDRLLGNSRLLVEEANEAEQLVSPFFVVGVVAAPGDQVGKIIVDARSVVDSAATTIIDDYWKTNVVQHEALLTTVGNGSMPVDFVGLWNAVKNASQLVAPHGPIVVIANVVEAPKTGNHEMQGFESDSDPDSASASDDDELSDNEQELLDSMEFGQTDSEEMESSDEFDFDADWDQATETAGDESETETAIKDDEDAEYENTEYENTAYLEGEFGALSSGLTNKQAKQRLVGFVEELRGQQPVFLISNLKSSVVERLGFGELDSTEELGNLLRGYQDVGLLQNADRWKII